MVSRPSPAGYRFDDIELDLHSFQVRKAGAAVDLEPKSLRVLAFLIENQGRAVSKDEILAAAWSGAFVTDNALTRVVAQIRKAIGDNPRVPRYIETVPTVGYRFVAEVERIEADGEPITISSPVPQAAVSAPGRFSLPWVWRGALATIAVLLLTVAWWFVWRKNASGGVTIVVPPARLDVNPVQITDNPGLDITPYFSPDGNSIVYASNREGPMELYVRSLKPGAQGVRLTHDGQQNAQPSWSPDGRSIAYWSMGRGGIWTIPAGGGTPRQLTGFGCYPRYSNDGKWIVFRSDPPYSLLWTEIIPNTLTTLWLVPADGGQPRQLTNLDKLEGKHSLPSWSSDDRWILFVNYAPRVAGELHAIEPKTGRMVAIRKVPEAIFSAVFGPGNRTIYYGASPLRGSLKPAVYRLEIDPETLQPIGEPREIETSNMSILTDLAISRDGRKLMWSLYWSTSDLWKLPLSPKTGLPAGAPEQLTRGTAMRKMHPSFSPDGSRVAYFSRRRGENGDIWIIPREGGEATALTVDPHSEYSPNWSADGKRVGFVVRSTPDKSVGPAYWTIDVASRKTSLVAKVPSGLSEMPHLSPDEKYLLYHTATRNGILNLRLFDLVAGEERRLTDDPESIGYATWSRSGQLIAAERRRGETTELVVLPRDGSQEPRLLVGGPGHAWPYGWSPADERIAFAAVRHGAWNLWWVSVAGGETRQLTFDRSASTFVRYPAWSPTGDLLVYERAEGKGNLFLVDLTP